MNDGNQYSPQTSWRCRIEGRDGLLYEEQDADGGWRRLSFVCEQISTAAPHHVLMIESETPWRRTRPDWAKNRRADILWRLATGFGSGVEVDTHTLIADEDRDDQHWRIVRLKVGDCDDLFYEEDVQDRRRGQGTGRIKLDASPEVEGHRTIRHHDESVWSRHMPAWARGRREQITARIVRGCPGPLFVHLLPENLVMDVPGGVT